MTSPKQNFTCNVFWIKTWKNVPECLRSCGVKVALPPITHATQFGLNWNKLCKLIYGVRSFDNKQGHKQTIRPTGGLNANTAVLLCGEKNVSLPWS